MITVNDTVELLTYPIGSINRFARVIQVERNGVYVSNINMPFSGTLTGEFIPTGNYKVATK